MTDDWGRAEQQQEEDDSDAFMGTSSLPACKFENMGTIHGGVITRIVRRDDTDPAGNVRRWPDGKVRDLYIVDLDNEKCLYARGNMYTAIRDALVKANMRPRGAHIEVAFDGVGTPPSPGFQAPKLFRCRVLGPGEQPSPQRQPTPTKAAAPSAPSFQAQQPQQASRPW